MQTVMRWFSFDHPFYWIVFGLMIVFFTYFYTAIAFDPTQVSQQMKQHGGFIPGIRPGKKTAEYIDNILSRLREPKPHVYHHRFQPLLETSHLAMSP